MNIFTDVVRPFPATTERLRALAEVATCGINAAHATRLSPMFGKAGAIWIGDWLPEQRKGLSTEQQAMVGSMLDHLKNTPAETEIARNGDCIRFGFALADTHANPARLDVKLTVREGEVTGISISDPGIDTGGREMVCIAKPAPSDQRPYSVSGSSIRKRLLEEYMNGGRKPLDTPYVDIKLTPAARKALDATLESAVECRKLPHLFYKTLRKSTEEGAPNWRKNVERVLQHFGDILGERNRSLPEVMENFREFAEIAVACQERAPDRNASDKDVSDLDVRNVLQDLCDRSFGVSPLKLHLESRGMERQSPLHILWKDDGQKHLFMDSNIYLLNIHFAAMNKGSAADVLVHSGATGFIETAREIVSKYPGNLSLRHFMCLLRRDAYPLKLDDVLRAAIDKWAQAPSRKKRKPSTDTVRMYKRAVDEIVEYACVNGIDSERFLQLLKDMPWQHKRVKAAPNATLEESQEATKLREWIGKRNATCPAALGAVKAGLSSMQDSSSRQAARDA